MMPPASFTARTPIAPSDPAPLRMTAKPSPSRSATDRKKKSIGKRSPIDFFFRSVADRLGDGFAVILSGAGSDGAIGVRAVKEAGGIILVQDPNEAAYASMPRSAIAMGVVDFVFPVRELVGRLNDLIRLKRTMW